MQPLPLSLFGFGILEKDNNIKGKNIVAFGLKATMFIYGGLSLCRKIQNIEPRLQVEKGEPEFLFSFCLTTEEDAAREGS